MYRTANRKDMFYYIILILTFIAVIIGTTFAIYIFLSKQKEGSSAVYTGTLAIEYLSGDIIKCHNLIPSDNPTIETTENVYKNNFKITNSGTLDSLLTIYLDINVNEFSNKYLMYKLYGENEEVISEGKISGTGEKELINNLSLEHKTQTEFTLIIWLKESGELQNEEMKKRLTGMIRVDANQKLE